MPTNTYTPITSQTLASASTISFTSIPSIYTDLRIVISGTAATSAFHSFIRFNSDASGNYAQNYLTGSGSSATASSAYNINQPEGRLSINAAFRTDNPTTIVIDILNYASRSGFLQVMSQAVRAQDGVDFYGNQWRSTAAVNSILILGNSGLNYAVGTTATMYGITAGV